MWLPHCRCGGHRAWGTETTHSGNAGDSGQLGNWGLRIQWAACTAADWKGYSIWWAIWGGI